MLIATLAIIIGFIILTWSADRFVTGAAATARNMNMSPMLIGLTVVSIGTSAPEILVSLIAALQGAPSLAIGNALGSNIANIGLVLGITALIAPLPIKSALAKRELPLLVVITIVVGFCIYDSSLDREDGALFLVGLVLTLYLMVRWQKQHPEEPLVEDAEIPELAPVKAWLLLLGGLALLLASSQMLVWGATNIAKMLGVSELVIGLTVVAIGTSLPELAASITSVLKGHSDIGLGNIVGSNIFNLLAVLSIPGLVAPAPLDGVVIQRDFPVMLGLTLVVAAIGLFGRKPARLGRLAGVTLLLTYALYVVWLILRH